jgi:hypothetical protein
MDQRKKEDGEKKKSRQENRFFYFPVASKPDLGPTQTHMQWVPAFVTAVCEVGHSPVLSVEFINK